MGITMSYIALSQKVSRKVKKSQGHLLGEVAIVYQRTDDNVYGLTPNIGVSEGAPLPTKTGCPKGSTVEWKRQDAENMSDCISAIDYAYFIEKRRILGESKRLKKGLRVKKGFLAKLISRKRKSVVCHLQSQRSLFTNVPWMAICTQNITGLHLLWWK